jgi:hypothetical protein
LQGIGYWDIQDTQLKGRWFYHYEHDASVTEMEQNPWLFNTGNEAILTDEERNWTLRR